MATRKFMELSIVIPIYNVERTLQRCIDSVLGQSFQDFEMILVDDGSKDNSSVMADEIAQSDSRISVIHQSNQGLSAARNTGIKVAKGKYITFIDSDDFIAQDTYKGIIDLLNAHPEYDILEFSVIERYGSKAQNTLILDDCVYQNNNEYWTERTGLSPILMHGTKYINVNCLPILNFPKVRTSKMHTRCRNLWL